MDRQHQDASDFMDRVKAYRASMGEGDRLKWVSGIAFVTVLLGVYAKGSVIGPLLMAVGAVMLYMAITRLADMANALEASVNLTKPETTLDRDGPTVDRG